MRRIYEVWFVVHTFTRRALTLTPNIHMLRFRARFSRWRDSSLESKVTSPEWLWYHVSVLTRTNVLALFKVLVVVVQRLFGLAADGQSTSEILFMPRVATIWFYNE